MDVPLQIAFEGGLEPNPALEARIRQEAARLERFGERITACHVAVVGRSGKRRHGDLYQVRVRLTVPGGAEIVADRNPSADHAHEDALVAVRDAFAAARRQLQDHGRRAAGKVKQHEPPPHGRVARLFGDEGYGFIESADGREVYFHRNAVLNDEFERLRVGSEVSFAETDGDEGPQASTVHRLGKSHIVSAP